MSDQTDVVEGESSNADGSTDQVVDNQDVTTQTDETTTDDGTGDPNVTDDAPGIPKYRFDELNERMKAAEEREKRLLQQNDQLMQRFQATGQQQQRQVDPDEEALNEITQIDGRLAAPIKKLLGGRDQTIKSLNNQLAYQRIDQDFKDRNPDAAPYFGEIKEYCMKVHRETGFAVPLDVGKDVIMAQKKSSKPGKQKVSAQVPPVKRPPATRGGQPPMSKDKQKEYDDAVDNASF